jgi:antitoxin ParD1/3/4
MSTMNISLPDSLKDQVDARIESGGFGSSSEYVRELIRRDLARQGLRALLVEGAESKLAGVADAAYFVRLRAGRRPGRKSAR